MRVEFTDDQFIEIIGQIFTELTDKPSSIPLMATALGIEPDRIGACTQFLVDNDWIGYLQMNNTGQPGQCQQFYSADSDLLKNYRSGQIAFELALNDSNLPDIALDVYALIAKCASSSVEVGEKLGITAWDARIYLDFFTRNNTFWKSMYEDCFCYSLTEEERSRRVPELW